MGVPLSIEYRSDYLYQEIRKTIKDLVEEYKFWADDGICRELEVIYYNKLLKFDIDKLADASTAIGFSHHKEIAEQDKEKICQRIIDHYKKRIELLKFIDKAVKRGRNRIDHALNGPVCRNVDTFVEDFFTCKKIPNAVWIEKTQYDQIVDKFFKANRNQEWEKYIDKLDFYYYQCLQKLLITIDQIKKSIHHSVSEARFAQIENRAKRLVKHMDNICDIFYLLAINYE